MKQAARAAAALALLALACAHLQELPGPRTGWSQPPEPSAQTPPPRAPCREILRLEVHKRERTLLADCDGGIRLALPIAIGRENLGAKRRAGDRRTPEGEYHIAGEMEPSRFHGFIPIDYPSLEDADRALGDGELSRADYRRIVEAHRRGLVPPWDTPLGGAIGFHGEGEDWRGSSPYLDWTLGCLALSDGDFEFLAERLDPGVPVSILP